MAAPKTARTSGRAPRYYESPDVVPASWSPERPGIVEGLQPWGSRMGDQGPDQGFALKVANRLADSLYIQEGERLDDAIRGCVGIALRRASMFSRAPVVYDLHVAFTIWGYYDPEPPLDLVDLRAELFEGVANVNHHYAEGRYIADLVPESTLRLTPEQAEAAYPHDWRALTGVDAD